MPVYFPPSTNKINLNSSNIAGTPASAFTTYQLVGSDSSGTRLLIDSFASNAYLSFRTASGTGASPSAITVNQVIGIVSGLGYGATGYGTTSRVTIVFNAASNWTDTSQSTYLSFNTTPANSLTLNERMRVNSTGNVGIGTTSDDGINILQVNGSAAFTNIAIGNTTGPTWTTGSSTPNAIAPVGSLYSKVGGAVGATLYVSRGAGTWNAVSGV